MREYFTNENGELLDAKSYILKCAEAFGEVHNNVELSSSYYQQALKRSVDRLDELNNMTPDDIHKQNAKDYEHEKNRRQELYNLIVMENKFLEKLRNDVEKWAPPTERHNGVKDYALSLIDNNIVSDDSDILNYKDEVEPVSDEEWLNREKETELWNIKRYSKKIDELNQIMIENAKWKTELKSSLDDIFGPKSQ